MNEAPVGKTKDAGWQIGVSRTMPVDVEAAWEYLTSSRGLAVWLGDGVHSPLEKGDEYETANGTRGEVRSVRPRDRIRITWQPPGRSDHATVQIALRPAASGCTFRFHTERLYDNEERELMREHWKTIAGAIEVDLAAR